MNDCEIGFPRPKTKSCVLVSKRKWERITQKVKELELENEQLRSKLVEWENAWDTVYDMADMFSTELCDQICKRMDTLDPSKGILAIREEILQQGRDKERKWREYKECYTKEQKWEDFKEGCTAESFMVEEMEVIDNEFKNLE